MLRDESRFPSDVSARLSSAPLRVALPGGSAIPSSNLAQYDRRLCDSRSPSPPKWLVNVQSITMLSAKRCYGTGGVVRHNQRKRYAVQRLPRVSVAVRHVTKLVQSEKVGAWFPPLNVPSSSSDSSRPLSLASSLSSSIVPAVRAFACMSLLRSSNPIEAPFPVSCGFGLRWYSLYQTGNSLKTAQN